MYFFDIFWHKQTHMSMFYFEATCVLKLKDVLAVWGLILKDDISEFSSLDGLGIMSVHAEAWVVIRLIIFRVQKAANDSQPQFSITFEMQRRLSGDEKSSWRCLGSIGMETGIECKKN